MTSTPVVVPASPVAVMAIPVGSVATIMTNIAPVERNWSIDITAEDEFRFKTDDIVTQKRISDKEGPEEEVYNPFWTREIASFLCQQPYLHTKWPEEMAFLQWTLFHKETVPSHSSVVRALRLLMRQWMFACSQDTNCLAPPSRKMMEDEEFKKIFNFLSKKGQVKEE